MFFVFRLQGEWFLRLPGECFLFLSCQGNVFFKLPWKHIGFTSNNVKGKLENNLPNGRCRKFLNLAAKEFGNIHYGSALEKRALDADFVRN
jgi:hypothetical protein